MLAVGNEELDSAEPLGDIVLCWICNKPHRVKYGEKVNSDGTKEPSRLLAFINCPKTNESYICGIAGKQITPPKTQQA